MASRLGDGLWNGFFIPEHKNALRELQKEQKRQKRPTLDEQECEVISGTLQQSMNERDRVEVNVFDHFENKVEAGVVIDVDKFGQRFKLLYSEDDWKWIEFDDVIEVNIL